MEHELTGKEVLAKLYERYSRLETYSITGHTRTTRRKWIGNEFIEEQPFDLKFEAPDKFSFEATAYSFGIAEIMSALCLQGFSPMVNRKHPPRHKKMGIPEIVNAERQRDESVDGESCYRLKVELNRESRIIWISKNELLVRKVKDTCVDQRIRTYKNNPEWFSPILLAFALISDFLAFAINRPDQCRIGVRIHLDTEHTFVETAAETVLVT